MKVAARGRLRTTALQRFIKLNRSRELPGLLSFIHPHPGPEYKVVRSCARVYMYMHVPVCLWTVCTCMHTHRWARSHTSVQAGRPRTAVQVGACRRTPGFWPVFPLLVMPRAQHEQLLPTAAQTLGSGRLQSCQPLRLCQPCLKACSGFCPHSLHLFL